jgi:hypothetical protein
MSAQARRVLVVTAGENGGLPEAIHDHAARTRAEVLVVTPALFDADFLVVDGDLAERARRRFGLPIVPLADAA